MKLFLINFLDELDHSKTSGSFLFFWPKNLKFSTQGTLPHLGCRDSRRREELEANWLLLHLFIHQAKHIWAQTRPWSDQVRKKWKWKKQKWKKWKWSDLGRVWCQKCLSQWRKWYSSSRFASRSSLLWESLPPKKFDFASFQAPVLPKKGPLGP